MIGLLVTGFAARPQSSPGPEIWELFDPIPDTAGIFPGEDLIILKNERVIRNGKIDDYTGYFDHDVVIKYKGLPISMDENYLQIYVRNERGARLAWQLQFGVPEDRTLLSTRLRNRKPNGQVIEMDEADSRYVINQTSKTQGEDVDYSSLPVPGVDAGDIVEIYSCYFVPWVLKGDEIYFNHYYPALSSSFTYEYSMDYEVSMKRYNFDRYPFNQRMLNERLVKYEFYNLPGYYDQPGVVAHMEMPYLVFRVDSLLLKSVYSREYIKFSDSKWDEAILGFVEELKGYAPNLTEASLASGDNLFIRFADRFPEASKTEIVWQWHQFLSDSISLRFLSEKEQKLPMEHWLQLRTTDRTSLLAWYIYFMDYIEQDYTIYLVRDIESGYLDTSFVYAGQGISIFFGIMDGEKEHYMFPPYETESYLFDEFPASVRGSVAIGYFMGKNRGTLEVFEIPSQDRNENWKNRILHSRVTDPHADRMEVDQQSYFMGEAAKTARSWYEQIRLSADPLQILENQMIAESGGTRLLTFDIDWESEKIYHHSLTFSCDNFISSHSDSTFSIKVKDVSSLDIMRMPPVKRKFGYYSLYPYYNITRYYIEFDQPVALIGQDTISASYSNAFGSARLAVYKAEENMILVETYYSADAEYLSPRNFTAINDLSDRMNGFLEKRIFFRYK